MLKEIRKHYGIHQSLFADFLCVTRSQLSMAETGKRHLSSDIMVSLLPLYLAIAQPKSLQTDEKLAKDLTLQEEKLHKLMERSIKLNEYKLQMLESKLAKMKEDQTRCIHILESMASLKAEAKPNELNLLTIIELNARKLQRETGELAQLKLELQIQHLQTEISYLMKRSK